MFRFKFIMATERIYAKSIYNYRHQIQALKRQWTCPDAFADNDWATLKFSSLHLNTISFEP